MIYLHLFPFFDNHAFTDFLVLGWDHIIDAGAYDHILFVVTLCALFTWRAWRQVLIIVTAFTVGHSITLALSALNYLYLPPLVADVLIPLTILITALTNVLSRTTAQTQPAFDRRLAIRYVLALVFGLIHGLAFANNFKFMLGEETNIIKELFAFNTGLELGQATVIIGFMTLAWMANRFTTIVHREWTLFFSGAGAGIAVILLVNVWRS